jgi:hypothetical protein
LINFQATPINRQGPTVEIQATMINLKATLTGIMAALVEIKATLIDRKGRMVDNQGTEVVRNARAIRVEATVVDWVAATTELRTNSRNPFAPPLLALDHFVARSAGFTPFFAPLKP